MRRRLAPLVAVAVILVGAVVFVPGLLAASHTRTASACHAHGGLPDRTCTSGARDRRVVQSNIRRTICRPGYTDTVRPPTSYTTPLKKRQMAAYGYYAGHKLSSYEEDHVISLELGG